MTRRLYYHDSYLREFRARATNSSPDRRTIYLDQTAFYPTSGGQPFDAGSLNGIPVTDVIDEDEGIAHVLAAPLPAGDDVTGAVEWDRRFDHMQQHTGQHLLSAVFADVLGAETLSFHLGQEVSTVELGVPQFTAEALRQVEMRANSVVFENRPVSVSFEQADSAAGLRKATWREGEIRIVTIADLDRSACGGTHVRATGEIGQILLRATEKLRGNTRVQFVCGFRAIRAAASDYQALAGIARQFSAPLAEIPSLVESQRERLLESEKALQRLNIELAEQRGHQAYDATLPGDDGIRRLRKRMPTLSEEIRTEALSFTTRPGAVFAAFGENPPAVLLACSDGAPFGAGEKLKAILKELGGRGGGNARLAQGSLPSSDLLEQAERQL